MSGVKINIHFPHLADVSKKYNLCQTINKTFQLLSHCCGFLHCNTADCKHW